MKVNLLKINKELKMNRFLLIAVSIATIIGIAFTNQPLKAQVFDEYGITTVLSSTPFKELGAEDSKNVIPASRFAMPPTFVQGTVQGRDDGFYQVSLPFPYEFNGEIYTSVWICVNGYVMFTPAGELPPITLPSKNPTGAGATGFKLSDWFFYFNASYPKNIIAPYMGDHFYRTGDDNPVPWPGANQYLTSEISTGQTDLDGDNVIDVFTIQWKNLNINFDDPDDIVPTAGITSSVATFQVKLYRSMDDYSKQGDFEFCYGTVNPPNPQTSDTRVITKGAVVGVKGASGQDGQFADFLNGLVNIPGSIDEDGMPVYTEEALQLWDKDDAKSNTTTTTEWQPSGGTDYRIRFFALGRFQKEETWGDGDVNFSSVEGNAHGNMSQPRFVTVADARKIMRAIVLHQPLPRERRREAYHGDVNHNGRYFFYTDHNYLGWNTAGTARNVYPKDTVFRINLTWKNVYYGDSIGYFIHNVYVPDDINDPLAGGTWVKKVLPTQISSLSQIYFEANEYDAALILNYLGGRLTQLPYLPDSFPQYGKIMSNEDLANGLRLGEAVKLSENSYKLPIYLNGYLDGALGIKARFNGKIMNTSGYGDLLVSNNEDLLVIAGSGNFTSNEPILYVTIETDENTLKVSDLRFNDNELPEITMNLTSVNEVKGRMVINNIPNPFTESTVISVNLPDNGNYTLNIFDSMGNLVKTFNNVQTGDLKWDGTDNYGNKLANGVYIYRLTGENLNVSKSMVLAK